MFQKPFKNFQLLVLMTGLLLTAHGRLFSQGYRSMLGNLSEWYVSYCNLGSCNYDYYQAYGDTLVNGYHYKFLDKYHFNRNFLIREDSIAGQVFILPPSPGTLKAEVLVYDFSLNAGDTIAVRNPGAPAPAEAGDYYVDSTRTETFESIPRKVLYLSALDTAKAGFSHTIWVEGIGSLSQVHIPGSGPQLNGVGSLSCFFKNGERIFYDSLNIDSCGSLIGEFLHRRDEETLAEEINVFPSIFHNQLIVENPLQTDILFELIAPDGRCMMKKQIIAGRSQEIELSPPAQGIYIAYFTSLRGQYLRSVRLIKAGR